MLATCLVFVTCALYFGFGCWVGWRRGVRDERRRQEKILGEAVARGRRRSRGKK